MLKPKDILRKYWGYTKFKPQQEQIINETIKKNDVLALLPTSGGKSLCYQVPTLMQKGVCIVISPLISLMKDQINYLSSKGIKSIMITSGMYKKDIESKINHCIYGNVKFIYLSPEKLQNTLIRNSLSNINICLIAVDEAHCISEWGHDFRPAYRNIKDIRLILENVPIIALTATATDVVRKDILTNLAFKTNNIISSSFNKKNISYILKHTNDKKKELLKLVEENKSSTIIYAGTRGETKDIASFLIKNNFSADYYHAGIERDIRDIKQEKWYNEKTRIMVATSAFGLGINKENVKLIIHMYIPLSIEDYFQQSGRAGRNGENSYAYLLNNEKDIKKNYNLINSKYPQISEIRDFYQNLSNFLQIAVDSLPEYPIEFNIIKFCKTYNNTYTKTYYILKHLENEKYIKINTDYSASTRIIILISNSELYKFSIENRFYENIIKLLLRKYPNIFHHLVKIDKVSISKELNIKINKLDEVLSRLKKLNIIQYIEKQKDSLEISFIKERVDAKRLMINEEKYNLNKNISIKKLNSIVNFINNNNLCRNKIILAYFGEKVEDCEKCDYCIRKQSLN